MENNVEQILDLARKAAQEAEVFYTEFNDTPVGFEANRLKQIQSRQGVSVSLRIIKDDRIGFAATTRLDQPEDLVQAAVEMAQFGAEAKFAMPSGSPGPAVELYDPEIEKLSIERMVEMGQRMIETVREHTSEIQCECSISRRSGIIRIINSRGLDVSYKRTSLSGNLEGTLIRDTDMLFVGDHASSCRAVLDVDKLAKETVRQLELARNMVPAPVGELPVLFTPRAVLGVLVSPLSMALNGRTVLQGSSPLASQLGQRVLSPDFTLWDDPTQQYVPNSRPCDDEGMPARRKALIEDGTVKLFLYDLQTAGLAGAVSTGNGIRGAGSMPTPSMTVPMIKGGTKSYEEIVKSVKDGVAADELIGAGQGNVLGGDFGGNLLLGYRIQDGTIVGRVKNTMIAGNVYEALKDIVLSRETEWVGGFLNSPHILCSRVSVSSKE